MSDTSSRNMPRDPRLYEYMFDAVRAFAEQLVETNGVMAMDDDKKCSTEDRIAEVLYETLLEKCIQMSLMK